MKACLPYFVVFFFKLLLSNAMVTAACLAKGRRGKKKKKSSGRRKGALSAGLRPPRQSCCRAEMKPPGGQPSHKEQSCQFLMLAAKPVWHPYMLSQNSLPWLPSIPFRAANRISPALSCFLPSPPTVSNDIILAALICQQGGFSLSPSHPLPPSLSHTHTSTPTSFL